MEMIRNQTVMLMFLALLAKFLPAKAVEPDWIAIDSLTSDKFRCPAGSHLVQNPTYHYCNPEGPFIETNLEGRVSRKGVRSALSSEVPGSAEIQYTRDGRIESRGEHIQGLRVGRLEYWWPNGSKRLVAEFEVTDVIAKQSKLYRTRKPKALSLTAWDQDGNQLPASLLSGECFDLPSSGHCSGRASGPKRKYREHWRAGATAVGSGVVPDVLGLHGAILELFRERGLRLAYSGRSDRVVLVLTSPRSSVSGDLSSYYRVRIAKSADCPDSWCEVSFTAFRLDAPIRAGNIDWSKSKPVDDEITQRLTELLDQEIARGQLELRLDIQLEKLIKSKKY